MTAMAAVFGILVALWLGAMIPGPSFVLVARNSIGLSRRDGLATALGMGVGGIVFGAVALAGLYTLLQTVEWLYVALKVAGGAYLLFMASKIWRGAAHPIAVADPLAARVGSTRKSFWMGLTTQLSNRRRRSGMRASSPRCCRSIRRCGAMSCCRRWCSSSSAAGTRSSRCASRPAGRANGICARRNGSTAPRPARFPRSGCG